MNEELLDAIAKEVEKIAPLYFDARFYTNKEGQTFIMASLYNRWQTNTYCEFYDPNKSVSDYAKRFVEYFYS